MEKIVGEVGPMGREHIRRKRRDHFQAWVKRYEREVLRFLEHFGDEETMDKIMALTERLERKTRGR